MARLGTVDDGAIAWHDPVTENPMLNDTEVWEVYNETMDAHPIHLHLVSFRILDRQKFKADVDDETGKPSNIRLVGQRRTPGPEEQGWKDTAIMYPGEVTRVVATFDREGLYVWHCHILSHEDHEMMRPYYVGPMAEDALHMDAVAAEAPLRIESVHPNPFNPQVEIRFEVRNAGYVDAVVYDVRGAMVRRLVGEDLVKGVHAISWNGKDQRGVEVGSGMYFLRITNGGVAETRKLLMVR